jgi:putative FmdB family regulatory protein
MPFYEYECPHCGYDEEVLQKITDKPLTKCPSCGKKGLRKLMSAPVFRLKGSGWYETDFKSDKENKRNLVGAEKEEAKAETTTDTKTDTKADTKADAKADVKPETVKADAPKKEPAKPVADKASSSARKGASRGKPRQKAARRSRR